MLFNKSIKVFQQWNKIIEGVKMNLPLTEPKVSVHIAVYKYLFLSHFTTSNFLLQVHHQITYWIWHLDFCVWYQFHLPFTGQIDIHNSVSIETNFKFFVSPKVIIFSIFICFSNNPCIGNKCKYLLQVCFSDILHLFFKNMDYKSFAS